MAASNPRSRIGTKHWTREEKDWLIANWKPLKNVNAIYQFRWQLSQVSGNMRSWFGVQNQAWELGLKVVEETDMITAAAAARELGIAPATLRTLCRSYPEDFPSQKFGHYTMLTPEVFEKLQAHYAKKATWHVAPWLTAVEAAKQFAVSGQQIYYLLRIGAIAGEYDDKLGWRIHPTELEHAKRRRDLSPARWLKPIADKLGPGYDRRRERARLNHLARKSS